MPDSPKYSDMTPEEYLAFEEKSTIRHEYVDGQVFAMCGATEAHNIICGNLFATLHAHLRGSCCRAYMAEMKVRIEAVNSFYYPDVMVTCEPYSGKSVCKHEPVLLIEVLSPSTQMIDRREKIMAYRRIASLKEYVLVHQKRYQIELHTKSADGRWGFIRLEHGDQLVLSSLPGKPLPIPVETIYEGVLLPRVVRESEEEYVWDSRRRSHILRSEINFLGSFT